jgi:hypothetical protein
MVKHWKFLSYGVLGLAPAAFAGVEIRGRKPNYETTRRLETEHPGRRIEVRAADPVDREISIPVHKVSDPELVRRITDNLGCDYDQLTFVVQQYREQPGNLKALSLILGEAGLTQATVRDWDPTFGRLARAFIKIRGTYPSHEAAVITPTRIVTVYEKWKPTDITRFVAALEAAASGSEGSLETRFFEALREQGLEEKFCDLRSADLDLDRVQLGRPRETDADGLAAASRFLHKKFDLGMIQIAAESGLSEYQVRAIALEGIDKDGSPNQAMRYMLLNAYAEYRSVRDGSIIGSEPALFALTTGYFYMRQEGRAGQLTPEYIVGLVRSTDTGDIRVLQNLVTKVNLAVNEMKRGTYSGDFRP